MMQKRNTILPKHYTLLALVIITIVWLVQFSWAIAAPKRQGQDLAIITNPPSNAVVWGTIQITGSADYPAFQFYIIEFSPEPVTGDRWQIVGDIHEAPVIDGLLETWDTTLVPDGSYTLRLRVVRLDGNYSEFFSQQVVVANAQPTPTNTPAETPTPESVPPTVTPTEVPPTPTIVIEQPVVETPTPRPVETSPPLEDPEEDSSFIPTVTGFSVSPLQDACLYGGGIMLSIFLLFGFLSALRMFILGFLDRRRRR
jgi:hypothetical protein